MSDTRARGQDRRGRRGAVFSVRVTDEQRAEIEALQAQGDGPRALGPWLLWRAIERVVPGPGITSSMAREGEQAGTTRAARAQRTARAGSTAAQGVPTARPVSERIILDLCGGSGSWSRPYAEAGYRVQLVTLPELDVRTFVPPPGVWGVLCAPPCTEFTMARNGQHTRQRPRDFIEGMETVNACLRVVFQARPRWWALENPVGHLSQFLGVPRDVWEPCDFGDAWTKRTAIWGEYTIPKRGPYVQPRGGGPFCKVCDPNGAKTTWCANAAHRAVTPPGFAQAFFEANP